MHLYEENPFCSRRIRPGAIPYVFPPGISADMLIDRLQENRWYGQIVGPHGTGKSTLLATLLPQIRARGMRLTHLEIQEGVRELPLLYEEYELMDTNTVLAIDGFEQLSYWTRRKLQNRSRRQGFGVLILAHKSYGLPDLYRTESDLATGKMLVELLLKNTIVRIPDHVIESHYEENNGNLREMLFSLYDIYEYVIRSLRSRGEDVNHGGIAPRTGSPQSSGRE
ncbi:MAG: hypothetical protein Q4D98_13890 [Planctomycetia bacterium]|nr:hypothetical protein [Planctomycetia bacterium]